MLKIKTSINLEEVLEVDIEDNYSIETPTDNCLVIKHDSNLWLCFDSSKDMDNFREEISWRVSACHRINSTFLP